MLVHGKTTLGQRIHSKWHQRSCIVLVSAGLSLPYNNANLIGNCESINMYTFVPVEKNNNHMRVYHGVYVIMEDMLI